MSDTPTILSEFLRDGQLLHLTLNAPKGNIIDAAMMAGIESALADNANKTHVKAIVFEGAGKHFSFGASVEEHQADQVAGMLHRFHSLFRELCSLGIPTFAVVRGQCLGGGLELAAVCSWIFASPTARFGQPEIKLGVFPPLASVLLPWRIGGGRGLDLCVSGRSIDAEEAYRIGLVHAVADDPRAACETFFAEHLSPLSASSLRFAERAARGSLRRMLESDLAAAEKLYLEGLMKTHDANEGIESFVQGRKPVFTGNVAKE